MSKTYSKQGALTKVTYNADTYYAIFARMVANTPAAGSTLTFDDTNVGSESGWKQIKINHAHAGTITISQSGNAGDFYVASSTSATSELSSFSSTTEGTKTIYVKFVPQNNGSRTCTLTISSDNGLSSLTYYLSGTGYNVPSITWVDGNGGELVSGETTLSAGDVLRAICTTGQTVSYSGFNESYFTSGTDGEGNPILTVREDITGTVNGLSVTANLPKNTGTYYAAYSEAFTLNVTNLTPQTIEWTDDIADISDEEIGHTITLSAVAKNGKTGANSGQAISYSMAANDYLSLSGNVLTVKAIGGPVAITATAAGNENFAPTSVTKYATVIDMSHPCATADGHSGKTLNKDNKSLVIYPTLPGKLTFNVVRSSSLFLLNKFTVKEYNSNNSLLATTEYNNSDISTSGETKTINCNVNATKIELYCDAYMSYSCTVSNVSTTRVTTSSVSLNSLSYATDPGQSLGKQVSVSYSNIPVFLSFKSDEDAGVKGTSLWSLNTSKFGGCGKKGSQNVTVTFQSNAKGNYSDKLYVRNNVGDLLHTIDLSASVTAQEQFLDTWNIADVYNTTDQVSLAASTTIGNTDFTFTVTSSNPVNIVTITDGGVMTFSGSGTATVRAYQPGDAMSQEFEATHNITINKVTPSIATNPSVAEIKYNDYLVNGEGTQISGGEATVTLRGAENTTVEGTFTWTNAGQVKDAAGDHNYSLTFTPADGGMYSSNTFTQSVTITRADAAIEMNDGDIKVKIAGINDDLNECKIDLDNLIQSKVEDAVANRAGVVTYEVISSNKAKATIDGENVFSATAVGDYTIRATQAQTDYYVAATDEFTVTVNKLQPTIVFDNTDAPEYIYSGDVIEQPAARMYNGKVIDRAVVQYVSSDMSLEGAVHVDGTTLTARDVAAPEGNAIEVTVSATADADALYEAVSVPVTHNYAVRAKRSTYFWLDGDIDATTKTMNIGETAVITYNENVDEGFTVGMASDWSYISYVHDQENRTITVTAQHGTVIGDGEQTLTLNQPGTARYFGRQTTYTFTVKKNVSAFSLQPLTTSMYVEDSVTNICSGLANTSDGLQMSCSPEGSMKYENGKLIALQAGTNTVTFSQPATEYWTGLSQSKTITVSKRNPVITSELSNRHAWYSIIEHPFVSESGASFTVTSSNETLARYIPEEDKIYIYGTSGNVDFTFNQVANYKYNAVIDYVKHVEIFQPNNRLPLDLTEGNLSDYNGGGAGGVNWNGGGVVVGSSNALSKATDWSDKYVILKFVGIPETLSFDYERTVSIATDIDWYFEQSANGTNWQTLKVDESQIFGGVTSGSESFHLNPDTRYVKLCYSGNYGGRFTNVHISQRKEIVPKAAMTDFGLGYNGNDPTTRTIKVDWYNVKPCAVTITGADADKFILGEGSATINSMLDNYGTADLIVSYKHETNSETSHTANLHIEDEDGNYADITLTGQTTPAPQNIIWRNDLTPMPINGEFPYAAMVESNQPLTLTSDHPEIVRVEENNTLVGVAAGNARVTAVAEGNTKWAESTAYIDIEVTNKNIQFITWNDNLSNRKREDGQTVNITLTATSTADLPITYELDEAAQEFASIDGNVLSLTGWGKGQVIAMQVGNEDYVAVQAVKNLVSRNPAAGCKPLVGEYAAEYTLHTIAEKVIDLNGEPGTLEFDAMCDAIALYGLWLSEYYDGYWHSIEQISRFDMGTDYTHYGPYTLNRASTKVKIAAETGATMTRTFKNVEVTLAKYLELAENNMNFSQVDKGSTKTQSFYINYSNLTGVLDVEMETESTQFEVLTATVGEDCGDTGTNVRIDIRFTGSTLGTEENAIIVHNNSQSLRIPVSATVVLPSQTITWEPDANILTTDHVTLSATATSELPVSFTSSNETIAEVVYEAGVYSLDIKQYGDVAIIAHQAGNENWSAATDKPVTFHISRVVPEVTSWPTAGGVVLPNTVGGATLTGGAAPDGIPGSFHWEDESQTVTRHAHTFNVVFEPTNTGYYEPVSHPLEIEILKTPQSITWNRADQTEAWCSDLVICDATATSGLPITYHSSDSTKAYVIDAVVNDIAVKKLYILKGGDITLTATQPGDETYAAAPAVSKMITLNRIIPTIVELPEASEMYVHHFLSNSTLRGGLVKVDDKTVTGVFKWTDGTELMDNPQSNSREAVFTPYNSDFYQSVTCMVDLNVQRFAPVVIHSFSTNEEVYGKQLSEFVINGHGRAVDGTDPAHFPIEGTFAWKDATYIPSVSETTAVMVFHPDSTRWYDDVEIKVPVTVTPAPLATATAVSLICYGQVLGEAVLQNTTMGIVHGSTGVIEGTVTWDPSLDLDDYPFVGVHDDMPIRFTSTDPNYDAVDLAGTAILTVNQGYVFDGTNTSWSDTNNWWHHSMPDDAGDEVVILKDVNISTDVAVESMTIKTGVTVTVEDGGVLTLGSSDSYMRNTYGNLQVFEGGTVVFGSGKLKVGNFTLKSKLGDANHAGKSGQAINPASLDVRGEAYFDLALDPSGSCSYGWYDFTVPFPVDAMSGVSRFSNDTHEEKTIRNEVNYAIMDFSESRHVETGYGWKKYRTVMQPGHCYSMTIDDYDNVYRFKKTKDGAFNTQASLPLAYSDVESNVRGWNGLGNGTMTYTDLSVAGIEKVQVYSHAENKYTAVPMDTFTYVVGSSFFVQAPNANTEMVYSSNGASHVLRAPQRSASVSEFTISMTHADTEMETDRLYVGATEEATDTYEIGRELTKFANPADSKVGQLWAKAYNLKLCDIDMQLTDGNAGCAIGLFAPQAATYTLAVKRAPEDAYLYLTYDGTPVWNLSMGTYDLDLDEGTTEGYGLRIVAKTPELYTGVENTEIDGQNAMKVIIDNRIYIITPEGRMYDLLGKTVK